VSSGGIGASVSPEHTMVDGIVELVTERFRMRDLRYIAVTKMRGTAFLEGQHGYRIADDGLAVFPRIEAVLRADHQRKVSHRVATGVAGLDDVLGGGLCSESTTLLLGPSGAGKTVLGLQFLAEGARRGERCLHFGFYEPPANLVVKADRLGFDFTGLIDAGRLSVEWMRPAEIQIDALVERLVAVVRERKIVRLFIDGFVGFRSTHFRERISSVFSAVSDELVSQGVTTLISDETRELFVSEVEVPTENVSAIFHNILFLRHVEQGAQLSRLICALKTRDSGADRRLWRYEIGDQGMELVAPFDPGVAHLLAGREG
jgi:circadian clock protein KaiC